MRRLLKNDSGITLVALVVTIIILLILAGISIGTLTGKEGLITKTILAKESHRGGEVQEYIDLALVENEKLKYRNKPQKTRSKVIEELREKEKLTKEEEKELENTDIIPIGIVDFSRIP